MFLILLAEGFSFQIVNTNLDELSPRARRRSALLTWQHIASLPPNLPVVYCGGFNTQKESMTGRFLLGRSREHGVVGDMRDAWPNARVRKNVSLIRTYHGFKGDKQGAMEFLKLIFRALCLCWDRQTQDLHIDWILFRGRSLVPVLCEVINDNIDGFYPSSHFPIYAEFLLPRSVRLVETPS
ncbi:DNAse I-like superfamily protein [Rhynchospora pubera]|uniref:DNAse I-like superfamily protein n=1 Tax=Rhynchospora pubera TaxID=906938 RepID=A0AAV8FKA2_9POAL|nr:DNAse I-like superfamily protein [Rhynchospora pubera]